MGLDDTTAFALEIAAVVTVAVLIVAIVAANSGARACAGRDGAAVHDVERALGAATITTYAQAAAAAASARRRGAGKKAGEGDDDEVDDRCAICQSEFAEGGGELVRVVPACGHFFHAGCDVDRWLRARRTCPLCRAGLCPLPRAPECPPMPPRAAGSRVPLR